MAQPSSASSQAPPAVPPGCKGLDDVDIVPGRSVTGTARRRYSCLSSSIDSPTNYPSLYASSGCYSEAPVVLSQWSSRQLQCDIINALVDGGADVNAGGVLRPIRVAIVTGNLTAVEALLARQTYVRGFGLMRLPRFPFAARPVSREYEAALMSVYRGLIQRDSTLAAERDAGGRNLVHEHFAAFSQLFIDEYLTLITSHGADMTATDAIGKTPLHRAAAYGSPFVAEWLCRRLTADDISRGLLNQPNLTPLAEAVFTLRQQQRLQQDGREGDLRSIRNYKTTIGVLLRSGAAPSIARMPTATEEERRERQLALTEYATVLSELSKAVMSAINSALAPQRDHSMLLARLLPLTLHHDGAHPHPSPSNMAFGPHEAEAIAWKIGAFLHEPLAAVAAIDQYLIGESPLRRRVRAAVGHFVKSAATQTSSNREVVGGTRYEQQGDKRVKVTVPPLQCFAVRGQQGGQNRLLTGVREVVHRARLNEVGHGVAGVVKGFNEHLGDQDCQFEGPAGAHRQADRAVCVAIH
ncbi:unnamed protein product [Vitrella brassicaformis CCMP3155]|uniref:Uncharacterized protein n=1 Tax=Vitrella brassicaformis (strain CCMP3155) TaxID=1169540 RepID=A0A0G4FXY4_VITBC|nr:unnamed protein product [Vitrella brassicaformis CCMP3155]|eukprot:CEM20195.1 unnamed protein product [Vitrella brassicaformis CCMP3155]